MPELGARGELLKEALQRPWYHTIELEPGVATPGSVDLRRPAGRILPQSLSGQRALDVGTFDGFWAFELEKRGAAVVAADLDRFDQTEWPPPERERLAAQAEDTGPGERFHLAKAILGSSVERVGSSIYDLTPEKTGGPVDVVTIGDLMLHLRDPVRGLEAVRSCIASGGRLFLIEQIHVPLTILRWRRPAAALDARRTSYNWWVGNVAALRAWLELAGFERIERQGFFKLKAPKPQDVWHTSFVAHVPDG